MVLLSLTGLLKTLLIMLGVFMVLRFIGRFSIAKRNLQEQEALRRTMKQSQRDIRDAKENYGKTTISNVGNKRFKDEDFTDYEEIN